MSKPICLITAPVATRSGYGAHSRDICRALIKLDKYDIKIWNVRWGNTPMNALNKDDPNDKLLIDKILTSPELPKQPELHIHIVIPNEFNPMGKYNIGITAGLEMTACPPKWVEGMNKMNMNIVPSNFVKDTMTSIVFDITDEQTKQKKGELKSEKPIEVLFEGTDTNIFKKTNKFSKLLVDEMKNVDETFNFLYTGHWLQGDLGKDRKDTGMLVKVFLETFKNMKKQPGLIMKTSGATFSVLDRELMLDKINIIKKTIEGNLPNIYLLHGDFMDDEMNDLYNHPKVKAHLTFTHGEGFGRPLLEASLSGKPIIAPVSTGQADFLSTDYTVELPHAMTKVPAGAFPKDYHNPEALWSTVNYGVAGRMMKDVFENYDKYKLKAKKQMIVNRQTFSHQAMKDKLESIVDKLLSGVPQQVQLKLPSLKKEPAKLKLPKLKRG